jgi:hypothetical protein
VAQIALLSAEPQNSLADEFLKQSVFFETKVLAHLDKGVPLDQFKVLVMPADLPKLTDAQKSKLEAFTAEASLSRPKRRNRKLRGALKPPPLGLASSSTHAATCWAS